MTTTNTQGSIRPIVQAAATVTVLPSAPSNPTPTYVLPAPPPAQQGASVYQPQHHLSGAQPVRFQGIAIATTSRPPTMPPVIHHTLPPNQCPVVPYMYYSPYAPRFQSVISSPGPSMPGPPQISQQGPPPGYLVSHLPPPPTQHVHYSTSSIHLATSAPQPSTSNTSVPPTITSTTPSAPPSTLMSMPNSTSYTLIMAPSALCATANPTSSNGMTMVQANASHPSLSHSSSAINLTHGVTPLPTRAISASPSVRLSPSQRRPLSSGGPNFMQSPQGHVLFQTSHNPHQQQGVSNNQSQTSSHTHSALIQQSKIVSSQNRSHVVTGEAGDTSSSLYSQRSRSLLKGSSGSYFYSSANLETTKKLQETNGLKAPSWFLYPPVPDSAQHLRNGRQHITLKRDSKPTFFMDPELRNMFLNRLRSCLLMPDTNMQSKIPKAVDVYDELTPLESPTHLRPSTTFHVPCLCLKAFNTRESCVVLLRRFAGMVPPANDPGPLLAKLKEIKHPNLIPVRDVFATDAFGDTSLVFVFDYHPSSLSLLHSHMNDPMKLNGFASPFNVDNVARPHSSSKNTSDVNMLPEPTAWNYFIQIIQFVRYVHKVLGKSCRTIDPSKVLIQDGRRLRFNCLGVLDLLEQDSSKSLQEVEEEILHFQRSDLVDVGRLMLCVTCGTAVALQETQIHTALDLITKSYRPDMAILIRGLVLAEVTSVDDLITATAQKSYNHLYLSYSYNDFLERQIMREMESGRLFRLISKLLTICDRTDLSNDREWSDSEDRYMLKLFRDFVFHQTDANGAPWIDLAHIISCMNKVDAGSQDKLILVSRDSQNVVIVTYSDVKKWLDHSFQFLLDRQQQVYRQSSTSSYHTEFIG